FISRVGNPFTFTGRELDAETGLMYFRARTYDTVQGRFKQRDPAGYADGMNLYRAYFASNGFDPFGLTECKNECTEEGVKSDIRILEYYITKSGREYPP